MALKQGDPLSDIEQYLYTRDDLIDLNNVEELASGIYNELKGYFYKEKLVKGEINGILPEETSSNRSS